VRAVSKTFALGPLLLALSFLSTLLISPCSAAEAQQPRKLPRIGFLWASRGPEPHTRVGIHQGLRELGYIEGQNIAIDYQYAEGRFERLPVLAAELVHRKVDIIITGGSTATRAAKEATSTIPIVMIQDNDRLGNGFVSSLARPGGNITGLSTLRPEVSGKRLELLKEIVPGLSRIAVLGPQTIQAMRKH
jgi:putative tryptophan/tyrosine transport system substrate-binding protein